MPSIQAAGVDNRLGGFTEPAVLRLATGEARARLGRGEGTAPKNRQQGMDKRLDWCKIHTRGKDQVEVIPSSA